MLKSIDRRMEFTRLVKEGFGKQSQLCASAGSPLLSKVLHSVQNKPPERLIDFYWDLIPEGQVVKGRLALRWYAAAHYCALFDDAPSKSIGQLRALLPSARRFHNLEEPSSDNQTEKVAGQVLECCLDAMEERAALFKKFSQNFPQTNETGRCLAFLLGLRFIAHNICRTEGESFEANIAELGTSAGLNLQLDHLTFNLKAADSTFSLSLGSEDAGDWGWDTHVEYGEGAEQVPSWLQPTQPIKLRSATGCDLNPMNVENEDIRRSLLAYVWCDEVERLSSLDRSIEIAKKTKVFDRMIEMSAGEFAEKQVESRNPEIPLVFTTSVAREYFPPEECERVDNAMANKQGVYAISAEREIGQPTLNVEVWDCQADKRYQLGEMHTRGSTFRTGADWCGGR